MTSVRPLPPKSQGRYKASTVCRVEGCEEPVKRNKNGHGLGRCVDHHTRPVGSRKIDGQGYVTVKMADGRLLGEHRMVMSQLLGRDLLPNENVHHVNGDRSDNRIENLELWYSPQPYGQRVADLLQYAVTHHREALRDLLDEPAPGAMSPHAA